MRILGVVFDRPEWLFVLLFGIPVLVAFYATALRSRRRALVVLLGEESRERLTAMAGRDRRGMEAALAVLTFALAVTALAGPRWGLAKDRLQRSGVDVAIVLDVSRSMLAQDVGPSRIERAKREVRGLLDAAHGSRVALVTFAGDARVVCPFTLDHDTISLFLDDVDPESDHAGGSDLAGALRVAGEALEGASGAGKAVVVLTDGESFGTGSYGSSAAAKLATRGVKVHTIGLGTASGAKIPVVDSKGKAGFFRDSKKQEVVTKLDAATLAGIASAGGGDYLDAGVAAFPMDELWRKRISQMAKSNTGTEDVESLQPRFQWFLLGALLTTAGWWLVPLGIAIRKKREVRLRRSGWLRAPEPRAAAMIALALALSLLPGNANAGPRDDGRKGDEMYRAGDFKGAAAAYETSARVEPSENASHNLGNARYRAGQFGPAAKSWADAEKMATVGDGRRDAFYNRGLALMQQAGADDALTPALLEESIESFNSALGLDPADADARRNRAVAIARWVEAQKKAQKAGGKSSPDGKGGQEEPSEQKDPSGDPKQQDGEQKGQPSKGGDPKNGNEGKNGETSENTETKPPQPGSTPKDADNGTPREDEIGSAEMERIDRLLDQREVEQRRIQRVKSGMRKKDGENDW